ncbi:MAG: 3'(2'),5'-bisphosphate nucleotidase CysQ [Lentimicrobiaceae bacterium]|jgi:3'(2'), 5'-bisphosphate nucleotidase|nr:3'(2'),5'-bisphosphate nucleotidase CysQ [Lentimicrobiaceae bacterium]
MNDLLLYALRAAIEAGKTIIDIYQTDFEVAFKNDSSPVTKADIQASILIKKQLSKFQLPFLSEEDNTYSYEKRSKFEFFWLVDPLDGTKEFVKRNDEFTVNIALIEQNKPVLGVVYAPMFDCMYFNFDKHAFRLQKARNIIQNQTVEEIMQSSEKLPLAQKRDRFVVLASRSHKTVEAEQFIQSVVERQPNTEICQLGSSLKMCLLAECSADIYPCFSRTSEWDTAAAHAILNASGGKIRCVENRNETLRYNKKLLTNPFFIAESACANFL